MTTNLLVGCKVRYIVRPRYGLGSIEIVQPRSELRLASVSPSRDPTSVDIARLTFMWPRLD
eukprot:scaffold20651_cov39-Prasinocladus_malaysianus.AAC.4